jgi:hypothetical protein
MIRPMRPWDGGAGAVWLSAIASVLVGCADTDGLLISVELDPSVDPADVATLDLWVGLPSEDPQRYVRSPNRGDAFRVDAWPVEVLVRAEDVPREIVVGAYGFADGTAVGSAPSAEGTLAAPVMVVPGELRYATLTLDRSFSPDADCLWAPGPDDGAPIVIIPEDIPLDDGQALAQLDCDGDRDPDDCNDLDPGVNTNAPERCDGVDNNCNGGCDEGLDADRDEFSQCVYDDCGVPQACLDGSDPPSGLVGSCDCDDANPTVNPNGVETAVCDGLDNDCDPSTDGEVIGPEVPGNQIDDDCNGECDIDDDGDLITAISGEDQQGAWSQDCVGAAPDCDDTDDETYPNALELCDGLDNDCDPATHTGLNPCVALSPATGRCAIGTRVCLEEVEPAVWDPLCLTASDGFPIEEGACGFWSSIADAPWPEEVYYDGKPDDERLTCRLNVWRPYETGDPINALCESNPVVRLRLGFQDSSGPGPGGTCRSTIFGGKHRGGYQLQLKERGAPLDSVADTVDSCDIELVVMTVDGVGLTNVRLPRVWVLVVQTKIDTNNTPAETALIPIDLQPVYAGENDAFVCPSGPSLTCE